MDLETVEVAVAQLKSEGKSSSCNAVRQRIGRGSKRDIVRLVRQLRSAGESRSNAQDALNDLLDDLNIILNKYQRWWQIHQERSPSEMDWASLEDELQRAVRLTFAPFLHWIAQESSKQT